MKTVFKSELQTNTADQDTGNCTFDKGPDIKAILAMKSMGIRESCRLFVLLQLTFE